MNAKTLIFESVVAPTRLVRNILDTPALILLYHRVTRLARDPQQLAVSPDHFAEHLDVLKEHYRVLSVDEFSSLKKSGRPFPRGSVLLTFDDGYGDNFSQALPHLDARGLQALFYITTSLLGTNREAWWDDLEKNVYDAPPAMLPEMLGLIEAAPVPVPNREQTYSAFHRTMKYSRPEERDAMLSRIRSVTGASAEGRVTHRWMSPSDVTAMARSGGAVLGAHTHSHVPLSMLSEPEQRSEIESSVSMLQELAGRRITHFSYPYGLKKDYDKRSLDLCRLFEFDMACANFYGQVHRWTNRLALPRILVRDWAGPEFANRLKRFFRY